MDNLPSLLEDTQATRWANYFYRATLKCLPCSVQQGNSKETHMGQTGMKTALFQLNKTFNYYFCHLAFQFSPIFSDTFKFLFHIIFSLKSIDYIQYFNLIFQEATENAVCNISVFLIKIIGKKNLSKVLMKKVVYLYFLSVSKTLFFRL